MSPFLSLILFTLLAVNGSVTAYSRPEIVQRGIERRMQGDVQLFKRFSNARWTFFDVGLGACGQWNVENDFIVALNAEQFGSGYPGPNCFRTITMSYNGKTAQARIMDRCPGCPYGGLDLSRGLFRFFDIEDKGVIFGEWHFGEGAPAPAEPAPTTSAQVVVPTTTSAPPPPPPPAPTTSSTYVPPAPQIITTSVPAPAPQPTPPSVTTTCSSYIPPPPAAPTVPSIIPDAVSPSVVPVVPAIPTSIIPSLNLVSASITSTSASVVPANTNTTTTSTSVSTPPPSTTGLMSSSAPSSSADPSALPTTTTTTTTTTTPVSIADMSAGDLSGIKTIGDLVVHLFNLLFTALQQSQTDTTPGPSDTPFAA